MGAVSEAAKEKKRLYGLKWARENRDKRRVIERRYEDAHQDAVKAKRQRRKPKIHAWQKADRAANPDKYRQKFSGWYERNQDYNRERKRTWVEKNPDALSAQLNRRRARVLRAGGDGVSREQWKAIVADYGRCCAYCARSGRLTMDHVIPLSKGGTHDVNNVVPACRSCNASKNNKTLIVWLAVRAA